MLWYAAVEVAGALAGATDATEASDEWALLLLLALPLLTRLLLYFCWKDSLLLLLLLLFINWGGRQTFAREINCILLVEAVAVLPP